MSEIEQKDAHKVQSYWEREYRRKVLEIQRLTERVREQDEEIDTLSIKLKMMQNLDEVRDDTVNGLMQQLETVMRAVSEAKKNNVGSAPATYILGTLIEAIDDLDPTPIQAELAAGEKLAEAGRKFIKAMYEDYDVTPGQLAAAKTRFRQALAAFEAGKGE